MKKIENHILYRLGYCPFWMKVRIFLEGHDLEIETIDMEADKEAYDFVKEKGGIDQSPALYIKEEDKIIYESDEIIRYIKDNFID